MDPLFGVFLARCHSCNRLGSLLCDGCSVALKSAPGGRLPEQADVCIAAFAYEGVARRLILDLKLRRWRCAAVPLARAMVHRLWAIGTGQVTVTWVPARPADIRARGFDHARLLAEEVGRLTGLPVIPLLSRVAGGTDQAALDRAARARNASGAFSAENVPERVLLIDDLVTTGATAGACATALRWAGAGSVGVLAGCRV